ncbi:LytR family transcriptional attenuator [Microcella putealis]|uniref:LytR family transcriptional attenuator n=1 Tax=Microcella putealis TaxID=337005 RepID=A0A4Q7LSS9_9MICO|nr:LCP family protein [Microcella putealis]RZS57392.1 LytR family transcriptional attenuator [Microcella putealis]TQM19465.1 LytR family transcriptional attenuator [Microcella putealis]
MSLTSPIRHPDTRQPELMSRRGWWLVGLNVLLPGSAQILAGNRRLGRFALGATLILWATMALAAVLFFLNRGFALSLITNVWVLWLLQAALLFYAVLWLSTTLNALVLVRLVKTPGRTRAGLLAFTAVTLAVSVGGTSYAAYLTGVGRDTLGSVFAGGGYVAPIDGRYTVLLLGGDAGPDRLGLRPDSITLASIDADSGAVTMIGIPRNLYNAPFPADSPLASEWPNGYDCGDDCLISYIYPWAEERPELYPEAELAGSTPGIEATRDAVEGVTGLEVQFVVLIDLGGFQSLIDAMGGVVVDAEPMQLGINGGPVVGEIVAGEQRMDGGTALWYARNRYNLTDFDRMAHQRQIQEAMLRQFDPLTVFTRFEAIAEASTQTVRTDLPQSMIGVLADLAVKSRELPITDVELVPPTVDNVNPDYGMVREMVAAAVAPPSDE